MKEKMEETTQTAQDERRKYRRLRRQTPVETGRLTYPVNNDTFVKGTSADISLGGIKMNVDQKFEEGTLLQVKITLPGWHQHHPGFVKVLEDSIGSPLTAICEVMRCNESEAGEFETAARFVNIDPDDYVAFQNYLDKEIKN